MAVNLRKKAEQGARSAVGSIGDGAGAVREKLGEGLEGIKDLGGKAAEGARDLGGKAAEGAKEIGGRAAGGVRGAGAKVGRRVKSARKTIGYRIAGEKPPRRTGKLILAGLAGAAAAFFLDPVSGKRRRHMVRDRAASLVGKVAGRVQRQGRYVASTAAGKWQAVQSGTERPPENDQVLSHKVESEVFASDDVPKGRINFNAENGVVVIRGEVDSPDLITDIERRVRKVQGVGDVRNLLHLPGTAAPSQS